MECPHCGEPITLVAFGLDGDRKFRDQHRQARRTPVGRIRDGDGKVVAVAMSTPTVLTISVPDGMWVDWTYGSE